MSALLGPTVGAPPPSSACGAPLDFNAVYAETARFVWTNARRLGVPYPHVDDVVQDVFLVVHRRLDEFDGRSSVKTWVCSILVNVVRDHRRRSRRKSSQNVELADTLADVVVADQRLDAQQALRVVQCVLERMSDEKAELIVLLQLEGMSVPEVAAVTGQNENTLYARLRAARREFDSIYAELNAPKEHP